MAEMNPRQKGRDGLMIVRITLYTVAALLLAAHFLRMGDIIATVACLAIPALFLVRQRWSLLLLQGLAYVAAAIWLATAWQVVAIRWSFGSPWHLAAVILVSVAAVSVLAGGLLHSRTFQLRYCGR
jgi:hypothetical protein